MTGQLGKRIDESHGDRDFYAFDLPAGAGGRSFLRLRVSALPNIAMCTMLYRPGFADAVGQYCVGRPGRDLVIPALELDPGRYLLAVVQDLDGYGGAPPYIHESISDRYTILAESAVPDPASEIEPNDHVGSATPVAVGKPCSATLGWAHDEDFFCLADARAPAIRWSIRAGSGESGVIEATPIDPDSGAPRCLRVRLAAAPSGGGERYVVTALPVR